MVTIQDLKDQVELMMAVAEESTPRVMKIYINAYNQLKEASMPEEIIRDIIGTLNPMKTQ